ncbi:ribonuclease Z [Candidatus Bathyarchaeota archaeon]|nr:ribonuclease Z [Candidatus Bathyarchaeota archaeon]
MELIFLGTGGSVPTRDRGLPSVVLRRGPELVMFDCGECSQRQMMAAKLGFNRKMRIFISHMHGDHVLGLPGLLQSMSFLGRQRKLEVYGPQGIVEFVDSIIKTVPSKIGFPLEVYPMQAGVVLEEREYTVKAAGLDHGIPCFGFALIEKKLGRFDPDKARALKIPEGPLWKRLQLGETVTVGGFSFTPDQVLGPARRGSKITYITDTRPCKTAIEIAKNSTVLVYDCTFDSSKEKRAVEYGHSTAKDAATVAKKACVKSLVLIHISAMYEDAEPLLREARKIFPNVTLAFDMMRLQVRS